jgi:hypothetical protein
MESQRKTTRKQTSVVTVTVSADTIAKAILPQVTAWLDKYRPAAPAEPGPLLITLPMLVKRTGLSISYWKREIREGRLEALRVGDRRVVRPEVFARWVDALPAAVRMEYEAKGVEARAAALKARGAKAADAKAADPSTAQPQAAAPPSAPPRPPKVAQPEPAGELAP